MLCLASASARAEEKQIRTLGVLLFPGFEMLDACGPMEIWGQLPDRIKLVTVARQRGEVASVQGPRLVADHGFEDCPPLDLLMVPGGIGVLKAMKDPETIAWIKARSATAE